MTARSYAIPDPQKFRRADHRDPEIAGTISQMSNFKAEHPLLGCRAGTWDAGRLVALRRRRAERPGVTERIDEAAVMGAPELVGGGNSNPGAGLFRLCHDAVGFRR